METLKIDGSIGHGGGQILRSALALSAILGKPFEMHSVRKDQMCIRDRCKGNPKF